MGGGATLLSEDIVKRYLDFVQFQNEKHLYACLMKGLEDFLGVNLINHGLVQLPENSRSDILQHLEMGKSLLECD